MNWPSIAGFQLSRRRAILLAAIVLDALLLASRRAGVLAIPLTLVLAVWGVWVLSFEVRNRLIWKVRNRLIVTYLFIFLVPIMLTLAFFLLAGEALTGEFAGYMVGSAMAHREAGIAVPARLLARELPADRLATAEQLTAIGIPSFEALVTGAELFRYPSDSPIAMPPAGWKDYTGIVYRGDRPFLMALVTSGRNRALLLAPLTNEVLRNLVPGLGSLGLPDRAPQPGADEVVSGAASYTNAMAGRLPPQQNAVDLQITGVAPVEVADWNRPNSGAAALMVIGTRPMAVLGAVFPPVVGETMSVMILVFYTIAGLLGVAILVSLLIGASMTRTITSAVHNLYEGTVAIGGGALAHRIPVKGRDQLATLGTSFNKMAEQLQQFVAVTREKERLQSEIAIASEVQTRLFPHAAPACKTVQMLGVCHAARMVSGDYYDYFMAADGELALALGDVAGKGISAALLMASIQSIMRTQLSDGSAAVTPANTVARLNRLLYASTSPEKYATFFFGLYNDRRRQLTYTNAGHLPPLLIHGDEYEFLEVTGSVVGAFPSLVYEERTVPLNAGDLLVAYTDGITEPENEYGVDFGAERLAEVVMQHRDAAPERIVEKVLEAVREWDTSAEQADDMTLMIVRGLA